MVAQAGYLLAGLVGASKLGVQATVFYLSVYLFMNLAAFAVIVARERETPFGDDIRSVAGIGVSRPLLAWPMTLAMLSLAGMPATAGFIGKFTLIDAAADAGYTWLGIVIVDWVDDLAGVLLEGHGGDVDAAGGGRLRSRRSMLLARRGWRAPIRWRSGLIGR